MRHHRTDLEPQKQLLAAEILDRLAESDEPHYVQARKMGIHLTEAYAIRRKDLSGFRFDRLITIAERLGARVRLELKFD